MFNAHRYLKKIYGVLITSIVPYYNKVVMELIKNLKRV